MAQKQPTDRFAAAATGGLARAPVRRLVWPVLSVLPALWLAGCGGLQSALVPSGPGARDAAVLFWVMTIGGTVIFLLVVALLLYSILRAPDRRRTIAPLRFVVAGGVILPVFTLSLLLLFSVGKGDISYAETSSEATTIRVTGNQWWWEIEYLDAEGQLEFATANEIRIPAGEPVEILLVSNDVIHSLWIPRLAGKQDLIPGQINRLVVQAEAPGAFRGQCAEFCGLAHAQMALIVEAQPREDYNQWLERQRAPAQSPQSETAQRGAEAFATRGCILCHTVRGHGAWGQQGPDLTHLGGRRTIGAGVLPNQPEAIAAWIGRNHEIKPGNQMPSFSELDPDIRLAIGTYLAGLQ